MHFVYILKSLKDKRTYVGLTNDLDRRISEHNNGKVNATKDRLPVVLNAYFACQHRNKAEKFERYLKSGSGRAFLNKHIF